jgi:hypothetical protein
MMDGTTYAGYLIKKDMGNQLYPYTDNLYQASQLTDEGATPYNAGEPAYAPEMVGSPNRNRRWYQANRSMYDACEAFGAGLVGVYFFSWLFTATELFLASEFAFWAVVIGIIVFGTFAFWQGRSVLKNKMSGSAFAVMAMVLGCITVLPPMEWAFWYVDEKVDTFLDKLFFPRGHKYPYHHCRHYNTHRPYYSMYKGLFHSKK